MAVVVGGFVSPCPVLCGVFPNGKTVIGILHVRTHVPYPGELLVRLDPFFRAFPALAGGGIAEFAMGNFTHSQEENVAVYTNAFHAARE